MRPIPLMDWRQSTILKTFTSSIGKHSITHESRESKRARGSKRRREKGLHFKSHCKVALTNKAKVTEDVNATDTNNSLATMYHIEDIHKFYRETEERINNFGCHGCLLIIVEVQLDGQ